MSEYNDQKHIDLMKRLEAIRIIASIDLES
jgi:hypothetical protein